jgi:hypothetical protein
LRKLVLASSLAMLGASACGSPTASSGSAPDAGAGDASGPSTGDVSGSTSDAAPVTATPGTWTWVDVPGSACDDGTPTGFAVNPGTGDDLLVYFEGGGACWDYTTCFVLNSATHGPAGKAQWATRATQINVGPFDRAHATNAFRASSYVYIPYCTGDLHGGSNVATYTGVDTRMVHHVGHLNSVAYLARIAATWPHPSRVVVGGTSAGGFGATLNYDLFRAAFPAAKMALVDDAGPLLEGEGVPPGVRGPWFTSWKLGDLVDPLCASCRTDLSGLYTALSMRHPQDRLALLSALTDPVISAYFMLSLDQFQTDLRATVKDRFDPTANARVYVLTGTQHGLLPTTATTTSQGVLLETWLDAMVNDGAWALVSP